MKGISHMVRENSMGLPVGARAVLALSPTFAGLNLSSGFSSAAGLTFPSFTGVYTVSSGYRLDNAPCLAVA